MINPGKLFLSILLDYAQYCYSLYLSNFCTKFNWFNVYLRLIYLEFDDGVDFDMSLDLIFSENSGDE